MTPESLRAEIERLGISQGGFGRLTGYADRTVRRWLAGELDIPPAVALLAPKLTPAEAQRLARTKRSPSQHPKGIDR